MRRTLVRNRQLRPRSERRSGASARVRTLAVSLLAAVFPLAPGTPSLRAQVSPEILQVLQEGGAWVALAIEDGVGSFESAPVPTLGIHLRGHLQIWEEHTGSWHVVMRDLARTDDPVILERLMFPGERVDFDYQTGLLGQVRIDVRWSEARDTTLRVWVGTETTPGESEELTSTDVYWKYVSGAEAGAGPCLGPAPSASKAADAAVTSRTWSWWRSWAAGSPSTPS